MFLRLKKAAEEFYLCVDPNEIAESLKLDELTADVMYNYWLLKRKVRYFNFDASILIRMLLKDRILVRS